ncbi:MAG: hypothetical protein WBV94_07375 [Blastocatellia bacterium]
MSRQANAPHYSTKRGDDVRRKMLAKIHIEFQQMRPDLRHSVEELRLERLSFCERALGLRKPLDSMRRLTDTQLGKVIDAIRREKPQRALPGCGVHHFKKDSNRQAAVQQGPGDIKHLAGSEQVWAIDRLFEYLRWDKEKRENFLSDKFNRTSPNLLTPKQANSSLIILFNIAASRDLKAELGQGTVVTRAMIGKRIPQLKRELGIDQAK